MRAFTLLLLIACGGATPSPSPTRAPAASAPAPAAKSEVRDDVIAAQVGTTLITVVEVDREIDLEAKQLLDKVADPALRGYLRQRERMRIVELIIDQRLILDAAAVAGVDATAAEVEQAYELLRTKIGAPKDEFEQAIRDAGMTAETYRARLRDQLRVARYVRHVAPNEPGYTAEARILRDLRARAKITIALREPQPPANAPQLLDASALLTKLEIEQLLGHALMPSMRQRLDNTLRSATFDSLHLRARPPFGESHDIAIQVWKDSNATLDGIWAQFHAALPHARVVDQIADTSFVTGNRTLHSHTFHDRKAGVIVMVTCGVAACAAPADALAIAKLVHARLDRLTTSPPALR